MSFPGIELVQRHAGMLVLAGALLLAIGLYLPGFKGFVFSDHVLYGWQVLFILLAYLLNWYAEFQWTMGDAYLTLLAVSNVVIPLSAGAYPLLSERLLSIGFWACLFGICVHVSIMIPALLGQLDGPSSLLTGYYFWFAGMVLVTLGLFGKWRCSRGPEWHGSA